MAWPTTPVAELNAVVATVHSFGAEDATLAYRRAVEDALNAGSAFSSDPPLPVDMSSLVINGASGPPRLTFHFNPNRVTEWIPLPDQIGFILADPTGTTIHDEDIPVVNVATDAYTVGPINLTFKGQYTLTLAAKNSVTGAASRKTERFTRNDAGLAEPGHDAGFAEGFTAGEAAAGPGSPRVVSSFSGGKK